MIVQVQAAPGATPSAQSVALRGRALTRWKREFRPEHRVALRSAIEAERSLRDGRLPKFVQIE